jgi:hypothetical protein
MCRDEKSAKKRKPAFLFLAHAPPVLKIYEVLQGVPVDTQLDEG